MSKDGRLQCVCVWVGGCVLSAAAAASQGTHSNYPECVSERALYVCIYSVEGKRR
jgi:hypothetical protein